MADENICGDCKLKYKKCKSIKVKFIVEFTNEFKELVFFSLFLLLFCLCQ